MISIFAVLLLGVYAELKVMAPLELQTEFTGSNRTIPYGVANFGHIPWGRKLIGTVELANPEDACTPITLFNKYIERPFVMVKRGGCSFVTKVRNVQNVGGSLAIIIDNVVESTETLIMSDDGFGYTVQIPSIFVAENEGDIIERYIDKEDHRELKGGPLDYHHNVMLSVTFDVQKKDFVSVYLALTFQNRESFKLVRDFEEYYDKLKNEKQIGFQVFYDQFICYPCQSDNFKNQQPDCLGGGRYCQYDPDGDASAANGRHVVEEELRQLCIFQVDRDAWFQYVPKFDRDCVNVRAYEVCSKELIRKYNIDEQKLDQCIENSFNKSSGPNKYVQQNYLLDKQHQFKLSSGLKFYPGALINNQSYRGAIDAHDIFGEICNSWTNNHPSCVEFYDQQYSVNQQGSSVVTIIFFVVLVLVVFFLFMVFIYRRMVRREMSRELSSQVPQMVSQYISFYEAKERKTAN